MSSPRKGSAYTRVYTAYQIGMYISIISAILLIVHHFGDHEIVRGSMVEKHCTLLFRSPLGVEKTS